MSAFRAKAQEAHSVRAHRVRCPLRTGLRDPASQRSPADEECHEDRGAEKSLRTQHQSRASEEPQALTRAGNRADGRF